MQYSADPLHRAPCVLDAWRQRQRIHISIAHGSYQRYRTLVASEGLVSPDCGQYARLGHADGAQCIIFQDLRSGADVHCWHLPVQTRADIYPSCWRWSGTVLALSYVTTIFSESFQAADPYLADTGVLLLDTATGVCTPVILHSTLQPTHLYWVISSYWSSTRRLAVMHYGNQGNINFSIVDAQGAVICSTSASRDRFVQSHSPEAAMLWAPDGHALVIRDGILRIWMWDVQRGSQRTQLQPLPLGAICSVTWSGSDSRRLFFKGPQWSRRVVTWVSDQQQHLQHLPGAGSCCTLWGAQDHVARLHTEEFLPRRLRSIFQVTSALEPIEVPAEMLTHESIQEA